MVTIIAEACDQQGQIWIRNEQGLHNFDNNNLILKYPASVFGNQWINNILIDTIHHLIWISTFRNGLFVISYNRVAYRLNSQNRPYIGFYK